MQKDFEGFKTDKSVTAAKKVLRHQNKLSAQVVYFDEIAEAKRIVSSQ